MRLDEVFIHSCIANKSNIAITDTTKNYTYEELLSRSVFYSNFICDCVSETPCNIAVYMDKTFDHIAILFAILISGCTYVPIDKGIPTEQLEWIINDVHATIVFSDVSPSLQTQYSLWVTNNKIIKSKKCSPVAGDKDIAYILYTSGSTGVPKGIEISHSAALSFIVWAMKTLPITSSDRFSSHAPFSFDLSVFDIYVSLFSGANLVLMPKGISPFIKSVEKYIRTNSITVWYSVPSIIMRLLDSGNEHIFDEIRILIYAGESMPFEYINKLNQQYPDMLILNFYGPTETNVITYYHIDKKKKYDSEIPIGYACPYSEIKIYDGKTLKENIGDIGELCVKSRTLMKGYHNHKTLEDEFYHTGDIVKIIDNNCYEYIGRIDNMVKVNGFRVELEEIERAIESFEGVMRAIVKIKKSHNQDRIIAYFTSHDPVDVHLLEEHLSKKLQSYKIPDEYQRVNEISTNSRGKKQR